MLAALDFALSLRRILRRIFCQHLRRPRSDDCGPASSGLLRSLESVPAMRRTRGQGASPPNPFHTKPVGSETDWASLVGTGISTGSAYLICRTFAPGSSLGRLSYFPVGPFWLPGVSCFIPFLGDPMTTATRFKRCPTSLPAIDIHSL